MRAKTVYGYLMIFFATVFFLPLSFSVGAEPVPVIFDTDMGNDIDDALALAILHAGIERGRCDLLAVTVTKPGTAAAEYIQMVNSWYRHPDIPIGVTTKDILPEPGRYLEKITAAAREKFQWESKKYDTAVPVLRRALAAAADGSVVMVQVGFSTNLADLLDSPADDISPLSGRELVAQKVRLLLMMAGGFTEEYKAHKEFNVVNDVPSAQKLASEWPTPIQFSGFEIGPVISMPSQSMNDDYGWTDWHPVRDSYEAYCGLDKSAWAWDLTCALVAIYPDEGFFDMSQPGTVTVRDDGTTCFTAAADGKHAIFLMPSAEQAARVRQAFALLCSEPRKN
ncbi:MAG: nucleoside hydrolase [Thermoguttaceae bacterium]|nr:nucleoside hydrolase [Thermoguttaceae bacterium]